MGAGGGSSYRSAPAAQKSAQARSTPPSRSSPAPSRSAPSYRSKTGTGTGEHGLLSPMWDARPSGQSRRRPEAPSYWWKVWDALGDWAVLGDPWQPDSGLVYVCATPPDANYQIGDVFCTGGLPHTESDYGAYMLSSPERSTSPHVLRDVRISGCVEATETWGRTKEGLALLPEVYPSPWGGGDGRWLLYGILGTMALGCLAFVVVGLRDRT